MVSFTYDSESVMTEKGIKKVRSIMFKIKKEILIYNKMGLLELNKILSEIRDLIIEKCNLAVVIDEEDCCSRVYIECSAASGGAR